jgi:hypothetical protein
VASLKALKPPPPMKYKEQYLKAFADAMNDTKKDMLKDYRDTVTTWKHKVRFVASQPQSQGGNYVLNVGTDDKIYGYVDKGTKPHIIRAKRSPYLRFRTGYKAKTIPLALRSRTGGASGGWVSPQVVHHPGTEARQFSVIISERAQAKFEKYLAKRMKP